MASNSATASFALLDCSGPIRCSAMPACFAMSAGHLPLASCTRFSPNARWPAAITGSMASGGKVLDTATSVTDAGSRPASRAARAIPTRTFSRPVAVTAATMRPLYRNAAQDAKLNEGPRPRLRHVVAGNAGKRGAVDQFENAILPAHRFGGKQTAQCLIGVHQRHAERVGEVLLGKRKLD